LVYSLRAEVELDDCIGLSALNFKLSDLFNFLAIYRYYLPIYLC